MGVQSPPQWTPQQPQSTVERSALTKVAWFGLVWIAGIVAGWVLYFFVFVTSFTSTFFNTLPPNPTPSQVSSAMGPLFQSFTIIIPVVLAIEVVGVILLTLALRQLRTTDPEFSLPSKLTLLLVAGVVLVAIGLVPLFYNLPNIIASAPSQTGATPSSAFMSSLGTIFVYLGVMALGGLLALIGMVGGLILGVWKLGTRYGETLFKIGAILFIIPVANVLAPILVLLAAIQVRGRLPAT